MIASLIIIGLAFIWLGFETDWLRVRITQQMEVIIMRLPSGIGITQEDFEFLKDYFKPKKKVAYDSGCWYCGNGHDRKHIEDGLLSFDLCECGSSIVMWPKKKTRKALPYAKLGAEIKGIMARNYNPTVASQYKSKRMV